MGSQSRVREISALHVRGYDRVALQSGDCGCDKCVDTVLTSCQRDFSFHNVSIVESLIYVGYQKFLENKSP